LKSRDPYSFVNDSLVTRTHCRLGEAADSCDGKQMGKMHTENHCTVQISSLWRVALRLWCGHCPAHSLFGRDQCYASQAVSVFRMSDTKRQSTTGRENVAIHCVRGGRPRRGNIWTMHVFLRDRDVGIILKNLTNSWMLWLIPQF